jgi:hypothetical protein
VKTKSLRHKILAQSGAARLADLKKLFAQPTVAASAVRSMNEMRAAAKSSLPRAKTNIKSATIRPR